MNEESIFIEALQKGTPDERAAFLDEACAANAELRRGVEMLLNAHERAGHFLLGTPDAGHTNDQTIREAPGTVIGPYKLLEQIGEGGMGVVFMAEQQEPVRRKVALKLIKPGMDTRQVIARFEAERQALAVMDHPSIARVLDAGATESGRPYFVMELVRGVPITTYCDENHLPIRERLELFNSVCQAIQHAHTKGIIHRDIKPSNVLVTRQDGKAVVKVIDFGVAKAMGQQLTEKTLFTNFAQMIGTPLYMSPEQAEQSSVDIDTRSDTYSLGVLLYELLTGTTPFDQQRLREAAIDEVRRIIREEEPAKPSTRLSESKDSLPSISAQRHTEPAKLTKLVRGELDWIVMKALEKDRSRRYETASAFAADVQLYLNDEPVLACPPSAAYRFRKFARRHKGSLLATGLVALTLVAGIIGTTGALIEARGQRRQAQTNSRKARQAVDEYFTLVSEGPLLEDPAQEPLRKELLMTALRYYEDFVQEQGDDPELRAELAAAYIRIANITSALGPEEDWLTPFQKGVAILEDLLREKPDVSALHGLQAGIYRPLAVIVSVRRPAETFRTFEKARTLWGELVRDHPTVAGFRSDLATWHSVAGLMHSLNEQPEDAARCYQQACDLREELLAENPGVPQYAAGLVISLNELSKQQTKLGQLPQAAAASRRALELAQNLARDYPRLPAYQELLAQVYTKLGQGYGHADRLEEREAARRQALAGCERLAQAFPTVHRYQAERFITQWEVGNLLWDTGRRAEATEAYRRVGALADSLNPEGPEYQELLALFLATCWDPQFRDARRAVELAKKAVERNPQSIPYRGTVNGTPWNTLGVAQYRAGDWGAALAALEKSVAQRNGGDCGDQLFLAMAHWQRGEKDQARPLYDKAAQWMDQHAPKNEDWRHFRAEAEELLGIKKKEP